MADEKALFFNTLPIDLQIIIAQYNPPWLFKLPKHILVNCDWKKILRIIYSINYQTTYANIKLLNIYYNMCNSATEKQITLGNHHTVIKHENGIVMSCGYNSYGQLGHGDKNNRSTFEEINGISKDVIEIAAGGIFTVVRKTDGTLMSCGVNNYGQLGNGRRLKKSKKFEYGPTFSNISFNISAR